MIFFLFSSLSFLVQIEKRLRFLFGLPLPPSILMATVGHPPKVDYCPLGNDTMVTLFTLTKKKGSVSICCWLKVVIIKGGLFI